MRQLIAMALICLLGSETAADWRDKASPYDLERLDGAPAALSRAVARARAEGTPEDREALEGVLIDARPVEGEALLGNWRCRTMKLGGRYIGLIVYAWFQCRISATPDGLYFEKLSGSQQTAGNLYPVYPASGEGLPERYIYLGRAHYADETERSYGGPTNTLRRVRENRDDPGILESLGRRHARIGFPLPVLESQYNFLELRR